MKTLAVNVINVWGKRGKSWLTQLPEIIKQLIEFWDLSDIKPVDNMSYNYVAKAIQNNKLPVVVKISCDRQLIKDEYKALNHFNGQGCIRVLDIHNELNALLLEQAIPGYILKDHHPTNIVDTINIYARVVKALALRPDPSNQHTHVKKWCQSLDRIKDKRVATHFVDKALELRSYLLSSVEQEYLCHGDLHLENIINHGNEWLCIDPKGIIGEMAFEAAAFDLIDNNEWSEPNSLQDKIISRVTTLAMALKIDKQRLLAWIFLRAIISIQWFIEDNGNPEQMIKLASLIYPLITKEYIRDDVHLTYEKISDWYQQHGSKDLTEKPHLDTIISYIQPKGSIFDLGCGTGQPIAQYFIKHGFSVTSIDGSRSQIAKGKKIVPEMQAICDDMRNIHLDSKFDCIIAWHSFFHLKKDDQRSIFKVFEQCIKPNGILVFTSAPEESKSWSENGGEMLYHASLSEHEYKTLLEKHNFDIVCHKVEDPDCGNATIWIAKRKP